MTFEKDKELDLKESQLSNQRSKKWKDLGKRPRYIRIIWVLILLPMFGIFFWQASTLLASYFKYQVTTKIQIVPNNLIEFPAVTICNENMYKKSAINGSVFERLLKKANPLYGKQPYLNITHYNVSKISMTEQLRSSAHNLIYDNSTKTGMLYKCLWKGNNCTGDFTEVMTEMGLCYTFNSGKDHEPRIVRSSGYKNSLELVMSVEQEEYIGYLTFSAGLRILVHKQNEYPLVQALGFATMPRSHVYVAMQKHRRISLPAPYETMCEDKKLPRMELYSTTACYEHCRERFVISKCGCRAYYMRDERYPVCNVSSHFECVKNATDAFDQTGIDNCDCTEPCDTTFYTTSLSYGQFPSVNSIKEYARTKEEKTKLKRNLLSINLFFKNLDLNIVEQVPIYDTGSMFDVDGLVLRELASQARNRQKSGRGEFGGLLGLFLGASIITILEIIDFLLAFIFSNCGCSSTKA